MTGEKNSGLCIYANWYKSMEGFLAGLSSGFVTPVEISSIGQDMQERT